MKALSEIILLLALLPRVSLAGFIQNVPYGNADRSHPNWNQLDIHIPPTDPRIPFRPAILLFHGGAFVGGDKTDREIRRFAMAMNAKGYVVFNANYRLDTEAPGPFEDIKTAMRWVKGHAKDKEIGVNPRLVSVAGYSAGATYAAILGVSSDPSVKPRTVIPLNGRFDLTTQPIGYDPRIHLWHGPGDHLEDYRNASPLFQIRERDMPPFILFHGTYDQQIERDQSVRMAEALIQHHNEAWRIEVPTDHGNVVDWVIDHEMPKLMEFLDPRTGPFSDCPSDFEGFGSQ